MGTWSIGHWVVVLIVVLRPKGSDARTRSHIQLCRKLKGIKQGMAESNEPAKLEADPKAATPVTEAEKESVPKS